MKYHGVALILCCLTIATTAHLQAADIAGKVKDSASQPVPFVLVTLTDAQGNQSTNLTDPQGDFFFDMLPAGLYQVRIDPPPGYLISYPVCGKFDLDMAFGDTELLEFRIIATGVSVDFGKPLGGGSFLPDPPDKRFRYKNPSEPFEVAMFVKNMSILERKPDKMVLRASFSVPAPSVAVEIEHVTLGQDYPEYTFDISWSQSGGGALTISLTSVGDSAIWHNGETLVIRGRVYSPSGNWLAYRGDLLCLCVESLAFFQNGQRLSDPQIADLNAPWSVCKEVLTPGNRKWRAKDWLR